MQETNHFKKIDIAKELNERTGLSVNYLEIIINDLINSIILVLEKKDKLHLKNFGTFNIKSKKERLGRNPKTGEKYIISARKVITFKSSKNFSKKLSNP